MGYAILETFSIINIAIMVVVFYFVSKKTLGDRQKGFFFLAFVLATIFTHYFSLIVDAFKGVTYTIETLPTIYYLPVYPCNMIMWANLLFVPFVFKPNTITKFGAPFLFILGSACAFFGLILNFNFLDDPSWGNIVGIKSIVSHVFLLYSCVSLGVFGHVEARMVPCVVSCTIGLGYFIACSFISNGVMKASGIEPVDSLYIHGVNENLPWLNLYLFVALSLISIVIVTTILETKRLPKEERWYGRLKKQGADNHD